MPKIDKRLTISNKVLGIGFNDFLYLIVALIAQMVILTIVKQVVGLNYKLLIIPVLITAGLYLLFRWAKGKDHPDFIRSYLGYRKQPKKIVFGQPAKHTES